MSEHLANMNDKLTSQKDEIDELKFAMNNLVSVRRILSMAFIVDSSFLNYDLVDNA